MLTVSFDYKVLGLKVIFDNLVESGVGITFVWNFGDGEVSHESNPVHTYPSSDKYKVTLSCIDSSGNQIASYSEYIIVSDKVKTFLSESIYDLIDTYMPEEIVGPVSNKVKRTFIEKWQLYIQPLVNHEIPLDKWNNEAYYEALENQLIVELAAYDHMLVFVSNMYKAAASHISSSVISSSTPSSEDKAEGDIKHITTGPTEVEYFDSNSNNSDYAAVINKVLQPGGMIDNLKASICMLASRLEIYLPICHNPSRIINPPKVVNRRIPGPLGGPDPSLPIKK